MSVLDQYRNVIREQALRNNIDPALLEALIIQESRGDPNAVSSKGATGVAQIMPDTRRDPGYGVEPIDPNAPDPIAEDIRFSSDYLNAMLDEFDDSIPKALAGYNAGPGRTRESFGERGETLPTETQNYIRSIRDHYDGLVGGLGGEPLPRHVMAAPLAGTEAPPPELLAEQDRREPPPPYFQTQATEGLERVADEVGSLMTYVGSGIIDTASLVVDAGDFGQFGEGWSDKTAAWLSDRAGDVKAWGPDWLEERNKEPLFITDKNGDLALNPNVSITRKVGNTIAESVGPGGVIATGGKLILKGVVKAASKNKWLKEFLLTKTGQRLTPAAAYGVSNSAYIWADSFRSAYEGTVERGGTVEEAREAGLKAALPAASVALVTGGVGGLGIGTTGSLGRRVGISTGLGALTEAPEEMTQYAAEQYAQGLPITKQGLAESGVLGMLAGGPTEGAMAAFTGRVPTPPPNPWANSGFPNPPLMPPPPNPQIAAGIAGVEASLDADPNLPNANAALEFDVPAPQAAPTPTVTFETDEAPPEDTTPPMLRAVRRRIDALEARKQALLSEQAESVRDGMANPPSMQIPPGAKPAMEALDNLGFDSSGQALTTLITEPNWRQTYDVAQGNKDEMTERREAQAADTIDAALAEMRQVKDDLTAPQSERLARLDSVIEQLNKARMTEARMAAVEEYGPEAVQGAEESTAPVADKATPLPPKRPSAEVQKELDGVIAQAKRYRDEGDTETLKTFTPQLMRLRRELQQAKAYETREIPPTYDTNSTDPTPVNADEALNSGRFVFHQTTSDALAGIAQNGLRPGTNVGTSAGSQGVGEITLVFPSEQAKVTTKESVVTGEGYNKGDAMTRQAAKPTAIVYDQDAVSDADLAAYKEAFPDLPVYPMKWDEARGEYRPAEEGAQQGEPATASASKADDGTPMAGLVDTDTTNAGEIRTAGEIGFAKGNIIFLLSKSLYKGEQVDVSTKEMVQNSFDATKAALNKGQITPDEALIEIKYDEGERTIEVIDQGVGMTPDIVVNAFLTIAGTDKSDLAKSDRSGSLGLAKVAFLFSNESISMRTTRDGQTTTVDATSEEMIAGDFEIVTRPAKEGERGTTVKVKVPDSWTDEAGVRTDIVFPDNTYSTIAYDKFLSKPLIHPHISTEVTFTDNAGTVSTRSSSLPHGPNFNSMDELLEYATIETDWATIELWVGKESRAFPDHFVYSDGLFQFEQRISMPGGSLGMKQIPHDIHMNIKPKVGTKSMNYPFDNSREGFRPAVETGISQIKAVLSRTFFIRELQAEVNETLPQHDLPRVDYTTGTVSRSERGAMTRTRNKLEKDAAAFEARTLEDRKAPPLEPIGTIDATKDKDLVDDDTTRLFTKADNRGQVDMSKLSAHLPKDVLDNLSDDTVTGNPDDTMKVVVNVGNGFIEKAQEVGDPMMAFAQISSVFADMRDNYVTAAEEGAVSPGDPNKPEEFFVGIGIDDFGGLNKVTGYPAVLVNPAYVNKWGNTDTVESFAFAMYETMIHELGHISSRSHGVAHNANMKRFGLYLVNTGTADTLLGNLEIIVERHWDVLQKMNEVFNDPNTTNLTKPIEGSSSETQDGSRNEIEPDGAPGPVPAGGRDRSGPALQQAAQNADEQTDAGGRVSSRRRGGPAEPDSTGWTPGRWNVTRVKPDGTVEVTPVMSRRAANNLIESRLGPDYAIDRESFIASDTTGVPEFGVGGTTYRIYNANQRDLAAQEGDLQEPPADTPDQAAPVFYSASWNAYDGHGGHMHGRSMAAIAKQMGGGVTRTKLESGVWVLTEADGTTWRTFAPSRGSDAVTEGWAGENINQSSSPTPPTPPEDTGGGGAGVPPTPPPTPPTPPPDDGEGPPDRGEEPPPPDDADIPPDDADKDPFDFGPPPEYMDTDTPVTEPVEEAETSPDAVNPMDQPDMFTYNKGLSFSYNVDPATGQVTSPDAKRAGGADPAKRSDWFNQPPVRGLGDVGGMKDFGKWAKYKADIMRYYLQDEHLTVLKFEEMVLRDAEGNINPRLAVHDALSRTPNMISKANLNADKEVLNPLFRVINGMTWNDKTNRVERIPNFVSMSMSQVNRMLAALNAPSRNYHTLKNLLREGKEIEAASQSVDNAQEAVNVANEAVVRAQRSGSKPALSKAMRRVNKAEQTLAKKIAVMNQMIARAENPDVAPDTDIGGSGVSADQAKAAMEAMLQETNIPLEQQLALFDRVFATSEYLRREALERGRITTEEASRLAPDPEMLKAVRQVIQQKGLLAAMDEANYGMDKKTFMDKMYRITYSPAWDETHTEQWLDDPEGLDLSQAESFSHVDVFGNEFDRALGRSAEQGLATQGIEALQRQIYSVQRRGLYSNEIAERIVNQALAMDDARFAVVLPEVPVGTSPYAEPAFRQKQAELALKKAHKMGGNKYNYGIEQKKQVPILRVKRGNKEIAVILTDRRYVEGLQKNYGSAAKTPVGQAYHSTMTTLKQLITTWNPEFTIANGFREWQNAILQIDSIKGLSKEQKQALKKRVRLRNGFGIKEGIKWNRMIVEYASSRRPSDADFIRKGKTPEDQARRRFVVEAAKEGLFTELYAGGTLDEINQNIRKQVRAMKQEAARGLSPGRAAHHGRKLGKFLERLANTTENAPRVFIAYETYLQLVESGVDPRRAMEVAASAGQNISVNFKRFGKIGRFLSKMFFFYNPAVQGSARTMRAYRMAPVHMARVGVYAALLRMLNEVIAGDDEDDRSVYEMTVPDWMRDRNAIIMLPGADGDFVSIPMAYGHNVMWAVGEKLASSILGHDTQYRSLHEDLKDESKNLMALAMSSFTPIPVARETIGSNPLGYFVPSLIQPLQEMGINRDWRGLPIKPEHFYEAPGVLPDAWKYKNADPDSVFEWGMRQLAVGMNDATGGDQFTPGIIDMHPKQLEHLVKSYAGSVGTFTSRVAESANAMLHGEIGEGIRTAPMIRKMYGLGESRFDDRARYYELEKTMLRLEEERETLIKDRNREGSKAFMELEGDYWRKGVIGRYNMTKGLIRRLSRARSRLLKIKNRSQRQNDQIDRLDERITEAMRNFNEAYFERMVLIDMETEL